MAPNRRERITYGLTAGAVAWLLAVVVQAGNGGLLNALINPFQWWLALLEGLEFLFWIPANLGQLGVFFGSWGVPEFHLALAGVLGMIGWILSTVTLTYNSLERGGSALGAVFANLLFQPVITIALAAYYLRVNTLEAEPGDSPAA